MKLLLIISSLLTVVVAQQPFLNCTFWTYADTYVCDLTINNPNGFDNFTQIGGIHLEGFTNEDIDYVTRFSGVTPNVPSIICETFPNVTRLDLFNAGLTEIDDNSFDGCSLITDLFLDYNRIISISTNAFVNQRDISLIELNYNLLTTLPENVFANQQNLVGLSMNGNPFEEIPVDLFRPLESLQILQMADSNLNAINNQWFTSNTRLTQLYLPGNRITLTADTFVGLDSLVGLNLASNAISEIPAGAFASIPNLQSLVMYSNNFSELQADSFPDLGQLNYLDIGSNPINVIHDGAFRGLVNLTTLDISSSRIRQFNSNSFVDTGNLVTLYMNFNEIEELPQGVFVPLPNFNYIGLWNNRLKTIRRNSFGTLTNLRILDLDGNVLNAFDRAIIDEAVNLNTLFFSGNLCANSYFVMLQTITEAGDAYTFFDGPNPGIFLRVNSDSEVQIALTPFNFIWTPMVEIFIGSTNNTRSGIRVNQETNVVTVPTPNVIVPDQWNDFRVTWANQVVLVFSGNNTFPFMGFTMQDFFPVNFYGLRAIDTRASWSVQPFE